MCRTGDHHKYFLVSKFIIVKLENEINGNYFAVMYLIMQVLVYVNDIRFQKESLTS